MHAAVVPSVALDIQIGKGLWIPSGEHKQSALHMSTMTYWQSFKSTKTQGDVIEQLKTASVTEISERRQYVYPVVAVTTFLGKQGMPFRGHNEQESSQKNQGNFMECIKLLKQFDPFYKNIHPLLIPPTSLILLQIK